MRSYYEDKQFVQDLIAEFAQDGAPNNTGTY